MQLRKLIRILNEIEQDLGGHVEIMVQSKDYGEEYYTFMPIKHVGESHCYKEKNIDKEVKIVSLGLNKPNTKEYR